MKKTSLTLLLCLSLSVNYAQLLDLDWARTFSGAGTNIAQAVTTDAMGNVYTAGYFSDTVDFDPGPGTFILSGGNVAHAFIQKLDANGNFVWALSYGGGSQGTTPEAIEVDANGNIYVIGNFLGPLDFDPGPGVSTLNSQGFTDAYLQKFDANGNLLWAKAWGGSGKDWPYAMTLDGQGHLYITGEFEGTNVDFDPGVGAALLSSPNDKGIFVQKMDVGGNLIWARGVASNGVFGALGNAIAADGSGNVLITGNFSSALDFDPGPGTLTLTAAGQYDQFTQKLDSAGNLVWALSLGGAGNDWGQALITDADDNIYVTGKFVGTVDFDPGAGTFLMTTGAALESVFLQKLDAQGNFRWAKSADGNFRVSGQVLAMNSVGKIVLGGALYGTADLDPGPGVASFTSLGDQDIFFQEFDTAGNFYGAYALGGSDTDGLADLYFGAGGKVYACGGWQSVMDFDPSPGILNMTALGYFDAFTLKLGTCFNPPRIDSISACDSLTWIDGITYTSSNYSATYLQNSPNGCDSVIHLALTLAVLDTGISVNAGTLTSNENSSAYQWLVCSSNFAAIPNATSQSFTPTVAGTYAVVLSRNGCTDTSACVSVVVVGQGENARPGTISISPNPNQGRVKLHVGHLGDVNVKVYNALGKIVFVKNDIAGPDFQFELTEAAGMYFVEVNGGGERRMLRMVVEP